MFRDSVEIDELKYPIRVREIRIRQDSEGAGRRRGAPGAVVAYGPKRDTMTAAYVTDGHFHPPRGTQGGGDGASSEPYKVLADGSRGAAAPDLAGGHRAGRAARPPPLGRRRLRRSARARAGAGARRRPRRLRLPRARTRVYGVAFAPGPVDDSLARGRGRDGAAARRLRRKEGSMTEFPGFRLDGKVAIVTGASSGIGAAIAEAMAQAGARVALVGRDEARLEAVAERCGEGHMTCEADITDDSAAGAVVESTVHSLGRIDSSSTRPASSGRSPSPTRRSRRSTASGRSTCARRTRSRTPPSSTSATAPR